MSEGSETKASTFAAAINLAKLCIGTGVLALPHATYRGGLLFSLLVMALVAAWNGTACKMIIDSKNHSLDKTVPADISSTYSRIAYIALGNWGVRITDFSVIVTLLGVCIAYQITFATLLQQVPGIGLSKVSLTLLCGLLVLPISLYRDIGFLSNFSFIALVCLVLSVFVIIFYGAWNYGMETLRDPFHSSYSTHSLNLFPQSIDDMTIFIGVATFCYGLCSMVCPIEESMAKREEFQQAVNWSLIFVWSVYGIIGTVGALLFFHHPDGIQDNILLNLPQDSLVATIVRVSMALVCILTFPLAFCAPAEMLEYKLSQLGSYMTSMYYQGYERIHTAEDDDKTTTSNTTTVTMTMTQSILRISLILLTTVLASTVPCFEMVISVLGCFTVAILSFVLPPILNLLIVTLPSLQSQQHQQQNNQRLPVYVTGHIAIQYDGSNVSKHDYYKDLALFLCGVMLSMISTTVTVMDVINRMEKGLTCKG